MKTRAAGCLLALLAAGAVLAQNPNVVRVDREDTTMVITNRALAENGARTVGNVRCEGVLTDIFFGPPGDVEMLIDEETRLQASIALIRRSEDSAEDEGQETIELLDGVLVLADRPPCVESFEPAEDQEVLLEQGRTEVLGSRFFLDRETDVAQMEGPIALQRAAQGESELLEATAQALSYDLTSKLSTLTGTVRVVSGERVSEAESLVLDEDIGLATLSGSPARSQQGEDVIEGETLLYYLDSNDVVVVGGVKGTLEVELD